MVITLLLLPLPFQFSKLYLFLLLKVKDKAIIIAHDQQSININNLYPTEKITYTHTQS